MTTAQEKQHLLSLYEGCTAFHGELHDHSASGGTSDGKCTLAQWTARLAELKMDFAAILDHRQVRHMYLPEWKDGLFIPGTEPGTKIDDCAARIPHMHYNILLPERGELEKLLAEFPEYEFTGGIEGHFIYPTFTRERFGQLIDAVKAHGGLFVHPHPKQLMDSDDPCDYWFRDETGIEVFYADMASEFTRKNYALWTALLAAGKRVWACAGGDLHAQATDKAMTTVYAEEKSAKAYLSHLRRGDFTCGSVGVRMCMGDTLSGGHCAFAGQRLALCVDDFHPSVADPAHEYRLDLLNENGLVLSRSLRCTQANWLAIDAQDCAFYRAEVVDLTRGLRIAVGNPIWNDR
ncbi:MAG: hypothetical protein IJB41_00200 [Clostridia bacterium]|nr:hypothetical protein [Clostridia bacterium]